MLGLGGRGLHGERGLRGNQGARSRGRNRKREGGCLPFRCIESLHLLHLFLNEIGVGLSLVPRPNELVEEQGLGEGSHLFRSTLQSKVQELKLNRSKL